MKTETQTQRDLKNEILILLKSNLNGLTMSKIGQALNVTTYTLIRELSVLESKKQIQIVDVGASKLVKLKN
jgi:predicted ArsR family transcriptional regulator